MAESIQRIIVRRALAGQCPNSPEQIIEWLEATARGWNRHPTPFQMPCTGRLWSVFEAGHLLNMYLYGK